MTDDELKAETQRLLTMSDSFVNANRSDSTGPGAQLMGHALSGCLALVFAAIPAWLASLVVDKQSAFFVFCSMIVFYGCMEISSAISAQSVAHMKVLDNINALRIALIDLSNRVGHIAGVRNK